MREQLIINSQEILIQFLWNIKSTGRVKIHLERAVDKCFVEIYNKTLFVQITRTDGWQEQLFTRLTQFFG